MVMNFNKTYCILAIASLMASCDNADIFEEPISDNNDTAISITSVSQTSFTEVTDSRAIYTESYATTFEEGDRLGIILVGGNGNQIANVPFSYTADGRWNNDDNQLYLSTTSKIVAYFPYSASLPTDITDAGSLKRHTEIADDQSSREAFTSSDLLVCEITNPGADISIAFSHAFSMLRFSSTASVSAGDKEFEYSVALEGLNITINDQSYSPCYINGGYVMIVRDDTSLQPELFKYTYRRFGEDRATKTLAAAVSTSAGTAYSFPCPPAGSSPLGLSAGDYYCVTEDDGMVVIIPAEASAMPAGLVCQGIVFHVMDGTEFASFAADNALDASGYPGIEGKHGMIVSLKQGGLLLSGYNPGDIADSDFLQSVFADFDESGNTDVSLGYRFTSMLATTYAGGNGGVTFTALDGLDVPLTYCTNWYIPSFNELKYLIRGDKSPNVASLDGQDMLNKQLTTVSGILLEGNQPSVSFKKPDGFCIMQAGEEMGWHGVPDGEKCRPICAF